MLNLYPVAEKKKAKQTKAQQTKRLSWTIEPDKEAEDLMETAMKLTGESRTEILLKCFHRDLKTVVREILEEREKLKKEFFSGDKDSSANKG